MVQGIGPLTFALAAASLAASAGGVWVSIRFALRMGVMDVPNERSSHETPVPRMGGVPMVLSAALAFGAWALAAGGALFPAPALPGTLLFALAMAALGFWDDLAGLSPLFRFLVQFAGAVLLLWTIREAFPSTVLFGTSVPAAVWILAGAFWIVWVLNLYNFMDGIDGLAGGEAAVASGFLFLVFSRYGEAGWAVANLFLAAASMGFLLFNWPPARVFMGDAGSAFLGAFYGAQSVAASLSTEVPFPVLVLPFTNFILDTTATLVRRVLRRERWYQAHRSHFYQRLTRLGMSHGRVTVLEIAAAIASCAVAVPWLFPASPWRWIGAVSLVLLHVYAGLRVRALEGS